MPAPCFQRKRSTIWGWSGEREDAGCERGGAGGRRGDVRPGPGHRDEETLQPKMYLNKLPEKFSRTDRVLVSDPMLATGEQVPRYAWPL